MQAFSVTTAYKTESEREDRYYLAVTLKSLSFLIRANFFDFKHRA
jgi:hypothetical protein